MTKFAQTEVLTDYIRSDISFLWRQDVETVLDDLGDLSDPRGTVYRMFEKLHMTTNKNVALLSQDSSFILIVHQKAWSKKEQSFLLRMLSVCAQMVKSVLIVRKTLRCSLLHSVSFLLSSPAQTSSTAFTLASSASRKRDFSKLVYARGRPLFAIRPQTGEASACNAQSISISLIDEYHSCLKAISSSSALRKTAR
jgi:hypothetical protein